MKNDRKRNTTEKIQRIWDEEAGINLSPDDADNLALNLSAFFDLLIEWDKNAQDKTNKGSNLNQNEGDIS